MEALLIPLAITLTLLGLVAATLLSYLRNPPTLRILLPDGHTVPIWIAPDAEDTPAQRDALVQLLTAAREEIANRHGGTVALATLDVWVRVDTWDAPYPKLADGRTMVGENCRLRRGILVSHAGIRVKQKRIGVPPNPSYVAFADDGPLAHKIAEHRVPLALGLGPNRGHDPKWVELTRAIQTRARAKGEIRTPPN